MSESNAIQIPKKTGGVDLSLSKFASYYLDKNNPETYGHATNSAIKAFNYKVPEQYNTARTIGSKMLTKINSLAQNIMENHGATIPWMVQFALTEMQKPTTSDKTRVAWWKELAKIAGLSKIAEQQVVNIFNQNNTNVNNNIVVVSPEEQKKFNKNFLEFINKGGELPE